METKAAAGQCSATDGTTAEKLPGLHPFPPIPPEQKPFV